jgi:hypothetical protein
MYRLSDKHLQESENDCVTQHELLAELMVAMRYLTILNLILSVHNISCEKKNRNKLYPNGVKEA